MEPEEPGEKSRKTNWKRGRMSSDEVAVPLNRESRDGGGGKKVTK